MRRYTCEEQLMLKRTEIKNDIQTIKNSFNNYSLNESKEELLKSLNRFEQEVSIYCQNPYLAAVINWYKNLFLQKAGYFPRSEELLDEALTTLENISEPPFPRWKLKICLSLGYIHRAQWNYSDAESYLKKALEMALSDETLSKFQGEIYSLLSRVNFDLGRYSQARQYVSLEKEKSSERYAQNPSNDASAVICAYSLVNFSKINRRIGFIDHNMYQLLKEAILIFSRFQYEKGLMKARLELAECEFALNAVTDVLETAQELESEFVRLKMDNEQIRSGILTAKVHQKMLEYEAAEKKLSELIRLSHDRNLYHTRCMADLFFEMGIVYHAINRENEAFEYFKGSAKVGMILGLKSIIVRSFNAARLINKNKAEKQLTSDLIYQDAMFVKNRFQRNINPLVNVDTKVKLYASTMFVDIAGFSNLMKKSNEDLTVKMVDELIDRLCLIIYQNNGYIDKFLGDGFMAIFEHGDKLDPDMAFKAVKCGIDIHRALKHKNRNLKAVYHVKKNINVRIGLSTGEIYAIVLGNYIKREFTYLGNSVNFASKLESRASNRLMLIDQETHRLTQNRIHAEKEKIRIPGLGDSIAYNVLSLKRMHSRCVD